MKRIQPALPFLLLFILSLPIFIGVFTSSHPYGGISLPFTDTEIAQRAQQIAEAQSIRIENLSADVKLKTDEDLFRQIQTLFGMNRANQLMRDSIPGYYWEVRWRHPGDLSLRFGDKKDSDKQIESVVDAVKGDVSMQLDVSGRLMTFSRKISDSTELPLLSETEARQFAANFVNRYSVYHLQSFDSTAMRLDGRMEKPRRVDYRFVFTRHLPVINNLQTIKVHVAGNTIRSLEGETVIPTEFKRDSHDGIVAIFFVFLYSAVGVAMVVALIRRIRSFEIGFRLSVIIGVFIALISMVNLFFTIRGENGWEILLPLIFGPLFIGAGLVLVWSIGESVAREAWREKFVPFDMLSRRIFFHARIGTSLVQGISLGVGGAALLQLLHYGLGLFLGAGHGIVNAPGNESSVTIFSVPSPSLYLITHALYAASYPFAFFLLFLVSFLRRWIGSTGLLTLAASVIIGVLGAGSGSPYAAQLFLQVAISAFAVWIFIKHDVLTTYLALAVFFGLPELAALVIAGPAVYATSAYICLGLMLAGLTAGMVLITKGDKPVDLDSIAPSFARLITERQRLQQELEIARTVQMSFLPKANPTSFNLDIASRCAPALEVGGDYYDFIRLTPTRLAVAVGDVSGKGTQAAFFMTLTKGFLRAIAQSTESPAATLTQANKLFFENVQRGVFISMVYAVFDTERQTVTLARAGHNPVIMRRQQNAVESVQPVGLALGLDAGELFAKSIEEVTIPYKPGDLFVFYTDGFPEATNKTMEEFGEERFRSLIDGIASGSAQEILDGTFKGMKSFVGRAKQHDDMTIVVVKATESNSTRS